MSLITISGGKGCGVEQVARRTAKATNLELYDDQRLQQEAVKLGMESDDLKNLGEKTPGFFDVLRGRRPEIYLNLMESLIYEVSRSGRGVILGHGSPFLLRDFGCAFHVLIHASEPYRIKQMTAQQGLSMETAEKMIKKSDHDRRGFLRFAFGLEWSDPSLYDLVINTEKFGAEGAADLIVDALKSQAIQECSLNALENMERLSLMKKVEAALLKEQFSHTQFHVEVPEKGVLKIYGYANTAEDKKQMVETTRKVSGVSEIIDEVGVLPTGSY
jgi:cytidylate kinase